MYWFDWSLACHECALVYQNAGNIRSQMSLVTRKWTTVRTGLSYRCYCRASSKKWIGRKQKNCLLRNPSTLLAHLYTYFCLFLRQLKSRSVWSHTTSYFLNTLFKNLSDYFKILKSFNIHFRRCFNYFFEIIFFSTRRLTSCLIKLMSFSAAGYWWGTSISNFNHLFIVRLS